MFLALTSKQNKLVTLLCDGQSVPVSEDALEALSLLGLEDQIVRMEQALRLQGKFNLINAARVEGSLDPGVTYEHHLLIDSTNSACMARPLSKNRFVCTAEMQGAGRGRRGRAWVSPFAQNLAVSWVGGIDLAMSQLGGLSVAVGIQLAQTLRAAGFDDVGVKWPNDLMTKAGKLGGILIELDQLSMTSSRVCVGVGLNVNAAPDIQEPGRQAVALSSDNRISRTELVVQLVQAIETVMAEFSPAVMSGYQAQWAELDVYHGQNVSVFQGDDVFMGRNEGIDIDGCLVLCIKGRRKAFNAGEVSLRGLG